VKNLIIAFLVIIPTLCLPVYSQNRPAAFSAGDTAAGRLKDGNWYLGVIEQINSPGEYVFTTNDGRQAYLKPSQLRQLRTNVKLSPGEKVAAVRDGGELFLGGTIVKVDGGGAMVKWTDGKPSSRVTLNRIITGVGDYERKKEREAPDNRLVFTVNNVDFGISRINGRVYLKGAHVGDYDPKKGTLTSYSGNNNYYGQITMKGALYAYKARTITGAMDRTGRFYAGGGGTGSINADGTISVSGKVIGSINKKNPDWNEMRAVVAVLAVYTSVFAY